MPLLARPVCYYGAAWRVFHTHLVINLGGMPYRRSHSIPAIRCHASTGLWITTIACLLTVLVTLNEANTVAP
ncbi:hypothetical protein A0H81_10905 [Grifola frondosa]|uniref:Uncharacterized protein n=1 Tax=Grifola frondosa TaxID=5627 RepID=A0A1C7LYR2_GRIFR|nr:hypothetical protein A0H81_10905 [Grifola frondosa]